MRRLRLIVALSVAVAVPGALAACTGEDPDLPPGSGEVPQPTAEGGRVETGSPEAAPQTDGGADVEVDPPSAARKCVLGCEAEAGASSITFYMSVQSCVCAADGGACGNACPKYCASPQTDTNACGDCIAKAYEGICSTAVNCSGDPVCIDFADCVRACVMNN